MTGEPPGRPTPIAGRVRELRLRRGLSKLQLAGLVGRGPMWVDRLEHGELEWARRLDAGAVDAGEIPVLGDLAAVLGVDLDELAGTAPRIARPLVVLPSAPVRVAAAAATPAPLARTRRRRPRAAGVGAAAAGAGLALAGAGLGFAHLTAHPSAARPAGGPAVASARLAPEPTPAETDEPALTPPAPPPATAAPLIAPAPEPTPGPAPPPRRPAPPAPAAVAVRVSAPAPKPAGRVTVFPWALTMSVTAGSPSSPQVTFTVSDPDGGGPATLGAVAITDPAVKVVRDDCSHAVLAPGGMCDVTVRFVAAKAGRYTGFLVIPEAGQSAARVPIEVDAH